MKTFHAILIGLFLFLGALSLTGCVSWLYEPEVNEDGEIQYVDAEATAAAREAGLIEDDEVIPTSEKRDAAGKEREVIYSERLKPGVISAIKSGTGLGDLFFPGLGGLLGTIVTGGLMAFRNVKRGRKFNTKLALVEAGKTLLGKAVLIFSRVSADLASGAIDENKDGRLSSTELKEYTVKIAKEYLLDLEFAERLVEIGTSSWDVSQKEKAVEALVSGAVAASA